MKWLALQQADAPQENPGNVLTNIGAYSQPRDLQQQQLQTEQQQRLEQLEQRLQQQQQQFAQQSLAHQGDILLSAALAGAGFQLLLLLS